MGAMKIIGEQTEYGIRHNTRVKHYPDGSTEVLCASRQIFRVPGYELRGEVSEKKDSHPKPSPEDAADNLARAQRRARTAIRDMALCNPMSYFVTLTFDPAMIDRYDIKAIMRRVNGWLDNQVRRKGLAYILIPELHKDGAETYVFDKGADSVDFAIANRVLPGDLVITQDYGLASMCLARQARVVHQDGWEYTPDNIDALLFSRHASRKYRAAGGRTKGPSRRTGAQDMAFEACLKRLLQNNSQG